MPAAMRMMLFLLLFRGVWTQESTPSPWDIKATWKKPVSRGSFVALVSNFSEAGDLNLMTPNPMTSEVPEKDNSPGRQVSLPSSDLQRAHEVSFLEASPTASSDLRAPEPAVFGEVSTQEPSHLEINGSSHPAEPRGDSLALHLMTNGTMASGPLETSGIDRGPPVTMATGSLETSGVDGRPPVTTAMGSMEISGVDIGPPVTTASGPLETSGVDLGPPVTTASGPLETSGVDIGPPVTTASGPLETSGVDLGPPVTTASGPLETSGVDLGPPVTTASGPLETSGVDLGPPVTTASGTLEISGVDHGPPVTTASGALEISGVDRRPAVTTASGPLETSGVDHGPRVTTAMGSLPIPKGTRGSPISSVKILTATSSASSKNTSSTQLSDQGTKGTILVAAFVTLLAVFFLVVLFLLWRRRQKRRTGVLTLNSGGKRNGVLDAWAGPAQVRDEEALTPNAGGSGGQKGSVVSAGEGAGRQPTLTTFLDRHKSQQCSLELGELKAGSEPLLQGEEEPLVGSKDEASEGPDAGEVEAPQCL